ncbi:hypothetical protein SAMN05216386_1654 [Nitrosospira briensis]|uniref:DNA primase n=1 Tax=Nitrosospira briensis TaxID=35799 RepID=A0A1I5B4I0_9PROT|nr:DNA primase [Nitrosospira briensis]SFN69419.1 hypothetical protein SAMN05216386_1654 [Nitrosospira briensis]
MSVDRLLSLLSNVKQTGPGRFVACCPAHDDKHPSLAIRELDDGRVLLHDFSGCSTSDVLAAVGLTLEDLFPERQGGYGGAGERRAFFASDILRCIGFEALLVAIAASNMAHGVELSETDRKRLLVAASRLQAATGVFDG